MSHTATAAAPTVIVVMGVSGSGKTTVAKGLAEAVDGTFIDADDLHSDAARAMMGSGHPLSDDDRWPWLEKVAQAASVAASVQSPVVVACSALRRKYRDRLREGIDGVVFFVHASGARALLAERLRDRTGHFMLPGLLDSQLTTLEPLGSDEDGAIVSVEGTPDEVLSRALASWRARANEA
jgi:gluconokinase